MCIKYSSRVSTCSKYHSLWMVQKMRNLITYFTALVPFGLDCRPQNPVYIGHCPGVGSSHGIIWVACSNLQMSGECRVRVESREKITIKRNRKKNHFMMRGRGGGKRRWINYNMDKSRRRELPFKRLMGMCRWMMSHFHVFTFSRLDWL